MNIPVQKISTNKTGRIIFTRSTYDKWIQCINTGEHYEIEYRWVRHDGAIRWMLGRANPVKNNIGEILMWIGTATDINDQKLINEKKDEFIGIASHELKTPLTSLKAYNQLLERTLDNYSDNAPKLYVQKTNEYINRLNSLISDLLDVSKIQAGKLTLAVSEIDFDQFALQSVESIKHIHPSHQLIVSGKTNTSIKGDRYRLEQVFTNYILNAIKYSPRADKVIISLTANQENIQVAVTDFGIGIPQENIQYLFTRFYRVESQTEKFQGLGLGLYISAEIIQRHGGKTWVESKLSEGSSFYFSLPIL